MRIIRTYLIHSGIREEQGRIVVGYRRARVHIFVTLALEEVDIGLPYLLRVHTVLHRDILELHKFCKIRATRRKALRSTICHMVSGCIRHAGEPRNNIKQSEICSFFCKLHSASSD